MNTAQIAKERLVRTIKADREWQKLPEHLRAVMRWELNCALAIDRFCDKLKARICNG